MKRFHFPFDYQPKVDLKNTIIYSSNLKLLILSYFQKKYHTIYIDPTLLVTSKYSAGSHVNGDRLISFDNKITNTVLSINNNQENYLMIRSSVLKNQNLLSYAPFIKRDAKQTNTDSIFNWNINLDLAMPRENLNLDYFTDYIKKLYLEIIQLTKDESVEKIYKPVDSKTKPTGFKVISLNKLEHDYPTLNLKQALTHYVAKHRFVIVLNNFKSTKSNNWLETPVLTSVDFDTCCGLYVYDEINESPINIVNVYKRPNGDTSYKQLKELNPIELENNLYDKRVFDNSRPTNMAISINYTNLLFYLLDKVHLCEVVASIWPDDLIEFVKKAKIEIL